MIRETLPFLVAFALGMSSHVSEGQGFRSRAARVVADQAAVDFGPGALPELRFGDVRFDSIAAPILGVTLWRGSLVDVSHLNPYIVASVRGSPIPLALGGFPAPKLEEFAAALALTVKNKSDAEREARWLITALDPNGAVELRFFSDSVSRSDSVHAILQQLASQFPLDTSWSQDGRVYFVRRTVLSRVSSSGYGSPWLPVSYSFLLDSSGHLIAWRQWQLPLTKDPNPR